MNLALSFYISFSELTPTPKPKVVETEKTDNGKNGSFSLEDKPEFKKLLSSSPPQMSPIVPDGDPPEPEELIKAIQVSSYSVTQNQIRKSNHFRVPKPKKFETLSDNKLQLKS